ncbi:MAG: hypothetical protein E6J42_08705 [Chloroflexi bacterium]|nr:MAG: hypothetical protein E6J42_08705 [Chloroflexota bacterium]
MGWLATRLRKKPTRDQEQALEAAREAPSLKVPLVLLTADTTSVSSFRCMRFFEVEEAAAHLNALPESVLAGVHAFWGLHQRPSGDSPLAGEAMVLIRKDEESDTVYVVSFVDVESAQAFCRAEVKRGVGLGLLMVYWAELVTISGVEGAVVISPDSPPDGAAAEIESLADWREVSRERHAAPARVDDAQTPVMESDEPAEPQTPAAVKPETAAAERVHEREAPAPAEEPPEQGVVAPTTTERVVQRADLELRSIIEKALAEAESTAEPETAPVITDPANEVEPLYDTAEIEPLTPGEAPSSEATEQGAEAGQVLDDATPEAADQATETTEAWPEPVPVAGEQPAEIAAPSLEGEARPGEAAEDAPDPVAASLESPDEALPEPPSSEEPDSPVQGVRLESFADAVQFPADQPEDRAKADYGEIQEWFSQSPEAPNSTGEEQVHAEIEADPLEPSIHGEIAAPVIEISEEDRERDPEPSQDAAIGVEFTAAEADPLEPSIHGEIAAPEIEISEEDHERDSEPSQDDFMRVEFAPHEPASEEQPAPPEPTAEEVAPPAEPAADERFAEPLPEPTAPEPAQPTEPEAAPLGERFAELLVEPVPPEPTQPPEPEAVPREERFLEPLPEPVPPESEQPAQADEGPLEDFFPILEPVEAPEAASDAANAAAAEDTPAATKADVEKVLKVKRWEKRDKPFRGFDSPPGRF